MTIYTATVGKALRWATSNSLWYFSTGQSCCADELLSAFGCRYDIERFGSLEQGDPRRADLLMINGLVTNKAAPYLKEIYEKMLFPKFVLSIGSCANNRGLFCQPGRESRGLPVDRIIPVDVYVAGCPPRPEAILNGILTLQRKIHDCATL